LVEALRRYLKASEEIAEEKGWPAILKELCDEFCIAGFDIHPFATFMAQMQFMLVLIPAYKKAMDEDPHFVLNRLPIFRTDSLVDETKGEAMKVTIETFESGIRYILVDTSLPVEGGNLKIKMPYYKDVFARTDLLNVQEYFAALQAVFDTVKESAWHEQYETDRAKLERNFKLYLEDKDWDGLVSFFMPYAEHFLLKFKELKETFGDGKLIKSVEDLMLAAILKNYVKYDFVVGNPPYVQIKGIPEEQREYYKHHFSATYGRTDLYILFIERGIEWLNVEGKLGFITSNKFILSDYGKNIRKILLENCTIEQLIDFGDSRVFKDATNYPCIFILEKQRGKEVQGSFKVVKVDEPKENILGYIIQHINTANYSDNCLHVFEIEQPSLREDAWQLIPNEIKQVYQKIEKNANKFGDLCAIREAAASGADKIFMINENELKENHFEDEMIFKFIKGGNVRRWSIIWEKLFVIYPYIKEENKIKLLNISNFPSIKKYLLKHKEVLEQRYCVTKGRKNWYEWHDPAALTVFEKEKIITPDISDKNNFAYDYEGCCFKNTCYVIVTKPEYDCIRKYICGLLNSNVLEFYFKQISPFVSGGYYRYKTQYLKELPIKLPKTKSEVNIADEITNKVELILKQVKLEKQIENFPDEYIQEYRSRGEEFDSTNISFKSNHKALEPVIEEDTTGRGYNIVFGKREKPVFVESTAKADYVVTALKGTRTKKDEKKQVLIPKSDTIVEEILNKLESDKAQIKSPSVAELEDEINELVYTLYGLNENDVEVIDDFLRRF
jgi:hypothetical protein